MYVREALCKYVFAHMRVCVRIIVSAVNDLSLSVSVHVCALTYVCVCIYIYIDANP